MTPRPSRLAAFVAVLPALLAGCAGVPERIPVTGREDAGGPAVLAVVAHPDDEIAFAALFYVLSSQRDGVADVATITDGAGGYRFATLAEPLYGLDLDDPAVAARHLPSIRRRELREGCRAMLVRDVHWFGQPDGGYTDDPGDVLAGPGAWDVDAVRAGLAGLLTDGDYDLVLTFLPHPTTHGHHRAATLVALSAVEALPPARRPPVVGVRLGRDPSEPVPRRGLPDHPSTALADDVGPWSLDREAPIGFDGRLDLQIVADWAITAHKSQGTMQRLTRRGGREEYWLFAPHRGRAEEVAALFGDLEAALADGSWGLPAGSG